MAPGYAENLRKSNALKKVLFVEKIFDKIQQMLIEYFLQSGTNTALTLNPFKSSALYMDWSVLEREELDWEWLSSEHYQEKMERQRDYGMVPGS